MAAKIKEEIPTASVELIRGKGGVYTIIADGEELWNKRASGLGFPSEAKIVKQLMAKAG